MAASYPYSTSAYQHRVNTMFQSAPIVYSNMSVAPPGLIYPITLPGYPTTRIIHHDTRATSTTTRATSTTTKATSNTTRATSNTTRAIAGIAPREFIDSPIKQHIHMQPNIPDIKTIPSTTPAYTLEPSIVPTREWLLNILKKYIFTHRGILIGDYPKYEIQKKDITDKFYKKVAELYPSDKYDITKGWLSCAVASPDFLPEYAERLNDFPSRDEFRVAIKKTDFYNLAKDIARNIEQYFNIQVKSNILLNSTVKKITLYFYNNFMPDGYPIVFLTDQSYSTSLTTLSGIRIPQVEMKYQHDYLTYDGNVYSVLDTYNHCIQEVSNANSNVSGGQSNLYEYQDNSVDNSISLYEIVNNIRNGIAVFMAYVEMEDCIKMILAARTRNSGHTEKQEKQKKHIPLFDKFISQQVKLDYYIKLWISSNETGDKACNCAKCNVVIDTDELVCITKCCRQMMHASCLLELYCQQDTKHAEFRCDKCHVQRQDKYGKNTELLMELCSTC